MGTFGNTFGESLGTQGSKLNLLKFNTLLQDGNAVAYYDPKSTDGAVRDINGAESIYWDLLVGKDQRGEEQASGVIIKYAVYEITACQTDFFYTGCAIGDIFPCGTVKTCDASNKVKRVLGNHLTQPVLANRPINGVFDGVTMFMKTAPFIYIQPESVYAIVRQLSWKYGKSMFDGNVLNSGIVIKHTESPKVSAYAGTLSADDPNMTISKFCVLSTTFNGSNSEFQVDDNTVITGNFGTANMGGFTIGAGGSGTDGVCHVEYDKIVLRKVADTSESKVIVKNYFKSVKPSDRYTQSMSKGAIAITFDDYLDGVNGIHTNGFPLLESLGVKGSIFIPTDWIETEEKWVKMRELKTAGWDIGNHSKTHTFFDTLTAEEITTEVTLSQAAYVSNGITAPTLFGYPGGTYALTGDKLAVITSNFQMARRYNGPDCRIFKNNDIYNLNSMSLTTLTSLAAIYELLKECYYSDLGLILTTHYVYPTGGTSSGVSVKNLGLIINFAKALGLDIVTLSQLKERML